MYCNNCGHDLLIDTPLCPYCGEPTGVMEANFPHTEKAATEETAPTEAEAAAPTETEAITPTETEAITPTEAEAITPTETEAITPTEAEAITPPEAEATALPEAEAAPTEAEAIAPTETEAITPTETEAITPTETEETTPAEAEAAAPTETESVPAQGEYKFCRRCGAPLVKGALFCTKCGLKIYEENANISPAAQYIPQSAAAKNESGSLSEYKNHPTPVRRGKAGTVICFLALAFACMYPAVGLILGIVSIVQSSKDNLLPRKLGIAAVVIAVLMIVLNIIEMIKTGAAFNLFSILFG